MKKFINFLMDKHWFKLHYSGMKLFTKQNVINIVEKACEAQRKACLRVYDEAEIFDDITDKLLNAQITECDYE